MVLAEKLFYGRPDKRGRGRREGLVSLRPTRLRAHMRALVAAMVVLACAGLLWGSVGLAGTGSSGVVHGEPLTAAGWLGYLFWLAWTLLGTATVWTFLAERTVRPALVALVAFGAVSAVLGAVLVW